ncbi:TPA: HNH endonuclease signature motif containing protein [Bacillus cereus]|uniref:HNH endonuclease signature motif containing protein n=1 Tax=Bacillus TaxID=1386 RepID=UPI00103CCDBD|nr:HNH endonuclease signature motif containing protein [Bacillus cereus]MDA1808906.1 HNH endonuclease signature motif containing protein [Bacillus cereus]TBX91489.1 HNH endonuclease [Bacillus cereus]
MKNGQYESTLLKLKGVEPITTAELIEKFGIEKESFFAIRVEEVNFFKGDFMKDKWVKHPFYDGYWGSSMGRVFREAYERKGRKYKTSLLDIGVHNTGRNGYLGVHVNRKKKYLHRFIMECFLQAEIPKGFIVDHKNNNPEDNRADNLQLLTTKQNNRKGVFENTGRTWTEIWGIFEMTKNGHTPENIASIRYPEDDLKDIISEIESILASNVLRKMYESVPPHADPLEDVFTLWEDLKERGEVNVTDRKG